MDPQKKKDAVTFLKSGGKLTRRFICALSQRAVWIITFTAMRVFTRFYVSGKESLHSLPTPLLIIANHRSYWDPPIILTLFPFFSYRYFPLGFMAADYLFQNFFYRVFFFLTNTLPAHKGRGLNLSLSHPRATLARGGVFVIFPFGKIICDNNYPEPGRGAAALAQEFPNLMILPVYLNTTPHLSVKDFLWRRKEMRLVVGRPFNVAEAERMNRDDVSKILINKIFSLH